jgi:hypothetical protein
VDLENLVNLLGRQRRTIMAGDMKAATTLVQDAIDKGVTRVEDLQQSLADLPFKVLEESAFLRGPAKEVRRLQDQTIKAVYGLMRRVNQQVGGLASELLEGLGKRRRTRVEADGA